MRYAHLAENAKKEAVNVLNGLTDKKNRDCKKLSQMPNWSIIQKNNRLK